MVFERGSLVPRALLRMADRIEAASRGRLRVEGTVEELRRRCRSRFKATYDGDAARETVFGASSEAVLSDLQRLGVQEFALTRTSLEDVYLELTQDEGAQE